MTGPGGEHPSAPVPDPFADTGRDLGRDTGRRRPEGGRTRPPLPPVRPVAAAPQTTMAPFTPAPAAQPTAEAAPAPSRPAPSRPAAAPPPASRAARTAEPRTAAAPEVRATPPSTPPRVRSAEPPAVERRRAPRRPLGAPADDAGRADDVRALPAGLAPPPPVERRRVPPRAVPDRARVDDLTRDRSVAAEPRDAAPWEAAASPAPPRPAAARTVVVPPAAPAQPPYGDWTKPSRSGPPSDTGNQLPVLDEPAWTDEQAGTPEAGHPSGPTGDQPEVRSSRAAELFPRLTASAAAAEAVERGDRPGTDENPAAVTGTVGGRAALRAQRQAAEEARRREGRKGGATATGGGARRGLPGRAATGLVAVAVVALGVLGVYSFASPHTRSAAAAAAPTTVPAPAAPATDLSDLPPLATGGVAPAAPPTAAAPVAHVPVTVLNETTVTGLAARVSGVLKDGGWPTTQVGTYTPKDIAATTVYFTQGDDAQRAAAVALVDQFPQLHGPVPRFFDVPGQPTPGLVVVTTGDWKP